MNVIICEDERLYRKSIADKVKQWMALNKAEDVQILLFPSSEELAEKWEQLSVDLLFLDIQFIDEMNGMELAKLIRQKDRHVPIVFVTSTDTYVYEGYSVSALRYLRKPIRYEEIAECMDIAYKQHSLSANCFFPFTENGNRTLLSYDDILYFEARSPYTIVHMRSEPGELRLKLRFSELPGMLLPKLFVRSHRSYFVNIAHVRSFRRNELLISNGDILPISRPYLADINKVFEFYYLEGILKHAVDTV